MRVIVTGSRDWCDRHLMRAVLSQLPNGSTIVHGAYKGADAIADELARELGHTPEPQAAKWKELGPKAGPLRNQEMVDSGADLVLAFPLGRSKGTWDCVDRAKRAGIRVEMPGHRWRAAPAD
jgi:hypothetical protein